MVEEAHKSTNKLLGEDRWGKGDHDSNWHSPGSYMA